MGWTSGDTNKCAVARREGKKRENTYHPSGTDDAFLSSQESRKESESDREWTFASSWPFSWCF